jgi:hypothetical protein
MKRIATAAAGLVLGLAVAAVSSAYAEDALPELTPGECVRAGGHPGYVIYDGPGSRSEDIDTAFEAAMKIPADIVRGTTASEVTVAAEVITDNERFWRIETPTGVYDLRFTREGARFPDPEIFTCYEATLGGLGLS